MLDNILNSGKVLNKAEQKRIKGGNEDEPSYNCFTYGNHIFEFFGESEWSVNLVNKSSYCNP